MLTRIANACFHLTGLSIQILFRLGAFSTYAISRPCSEMFTRSPDIRMSSQWHSGNPKLQAPLALPILQGSLQNPSSENAASQHEFLGPPPTGITKPSWYSPLGLQHVPPRPQVQGMGLAGMMPTSPPTPPSRGIHHATGHCRVPSPLHGSPIS